MYKEHEICKSPSDPDQKLWRYVNEFKFKSIIKEKALYFSRTDKFKDPFEGTFSEKTKGEFESHNHFMGIDKHFFDDLP